MPSPAVPAAVHLGSESDDNRVPIGADLIGIRSQIGIVAACRYGRHADVTWVNLHERYRSVRIRLISETFLEWITQRAIIKYDVRLTPDSCRKLIDRLVRTCFVGLGHS